LATLIGSVAQLGRPLIRIGRTDGQDDFLALVDTGFNGGLFIAAADAAALGVPLNDIKVKDKLAGGVQQSVVRTKWSINWFGEQRTVDVLVSLEPGHTLRPDEPVALLGTALLRPNLLLIDYDDRAVEIEGQG
jgi:predicted aspartyl protease